MHMRQNLRVLLMSPESSPISYGNQVIDHGVSCLSLPVWHFDLILVLKPIPAFSQDP